MKLNGRHYVLPGGSVGWCFVDILTAELNYLALGHYPAERCLVFGSVILQKDRMIKKGSDICHLLEKHLNLWQKDKLDLLVNEATQCDHSVHFNHPRYKNPEDHVIRVFSKLMLEGMFVLPSVLFLSVLVVVFWILMPQFHLDRTVPFLLEMYFSISIQPCVPPDSVLPLCDALLLFQDVEVCAAHV